MPKKRNKLYILLKSYRNLKTDEYMGHNPKEKPKKDRKSNPRRLCSGIISPLLTTSTSHICSHQIDDHRKSRRTTYRANKQAKGKLEPKDFSMQSNILSQSTIHTTPKHVMTFNQYTKTRLDSSGYI